jgi:hypothetical protein
MVGWMQIACLSAYSFVSHALTHAIRVVAPHARATTVRLLSTRIRRRATSRRLRRDQAQFLHHAPLMPRREMSTHREPTIAQTPR